MRDTLLQIFVQYALPPLATAIGLGLLWVLKQAGSWLTTRATSSKAAAIALRVEHLAELVVQDIEATMKPQLEAAAADGVLSKEELAKLKATAMERLVALLQENGITELKAAFGIFAPQVEMYLSGAIEKAVAGLAPAAPASPP